MYTYIYYNYVCISVCVRACVYVCVHDECLRAVWK